MGGCDVTPAGYAHMTAMLQPWHPDELLLRWKVDTICVRLQRVHRRSFKRFSGSVASVNSTDVPKSSAMSDIRKTVFEHRNLWRCLGVFNSRKRMSNKRIQTRICLRMLMMNYGQRRSGVESWSV